MNTRRGLSSRTKLSRLTRSSGGLSVGKLELARRICSRSEQLDRINVFRLGVTPMTSLATNRVKGFSERSKVSRFVKTLENSIASMALRRKVMRRRNRNPTTSQCLSSVAFVTVKSLTTSRYFKASKVDVTLKISVSDVRFLQPSNETVSMMMLPLLELEMFRLLRVLNFNAS